MKNQLSGLMKKPMAFCKKYYLVILVLAVGGIVTMLVLGERDRRPTPSPNSPATTHPRYQDVALVNEIEQKTANQVVEGFTDNVTDAAQLRPSAGSKNVVLFHAGWCGHCQRFMPAYDHAATTVNARPDSSLRLMKVDCSEDASIATQFNVRGYPTVMLFTHDGERELSGFDRTEAGFLRYVDSL